MLVATPAQTASYSTLHNSNNSASAATSATKKCSTSSAASGATKPLNNNNHATSTVSTKSSLNSNINSTIHNYHSNTKNDNIVINKLSNQNKSMAASSREIISSSKKAATTHSSKTENSTNTISTTNTKQQSFIQTLKDSVQKALISTTGSNNHTNSIPAKHSNDYKLQNNCNNSKTSVSNNVTSSSSSSTSHNANKVSTTTSLNTTGNATAATQPSSSASVVRGKYFSCSLSKLHTVAPTVIHRYPEERQYASSTDSLHKEMCHFKPIRIVPKTPFKSGSKSRGSSLRFPKANLATKKIEFILKSNCDVNNRKRKQQQNRTQNDKIIVVADEYDENEQENKEFPRIYKPKPSLTCLSTSFNTPNHTSAFVCLIADVKNFVNMQSKDHLASASVDGEPDDSIKELFTRKKQKPIKKQLQERTVKETPKTRSNRQSITKAVEKNNKKQNAKTNNISKASTVAITKAKSLRNVGRAKSKTNNIVDLAAMKRKSKTQNSVSVPAFANDKTKVVASTSKSTRKRKAAQEDDDHDLNQQLMLPTLSPLTLPTKSTSNRSILLTARKSSRLSAKANVVTPANKRARRSSTNQASSQTTANEFTQNEHKTLKTSSCLSPPMTRSRLKRLTEQGKIIESAVAVTKRRKI